MEAANGSSLYIVQMHEQPVQRLDHYNLQTSIGSLNRWTFIKDSITPKNTVKTMAIVAAIFYSPALVLRGSGMIPAQVTWWSEFTSLTAVSFNCWKSPLTAGEFQILGVEALSVLGVQAIGAKILYNQLTDVRIPTPERFNAWRIHRIAVFLENHLVPERYETHEWFVANDLICPVTHFAIRFPSYEKTTDSQGREIRKYYETSAILAWLKTNPTSPCTRKPLRPEDLTYDFEKAESIENKLQLFDATYLTNTNLTR